MFNTATRKIGSEVKFTTVEGRDTRGTVKGLRSGPRGVEFLMEHQVKRNGKVVTDRSWVLASTTKG